MRLTLLLLHQKLFLEVAKLFAQLLSILAQFRFCHGVKIWARDATLMALKVICIIILIDLDYLRIATPAVTNVLDFSKLVTFHG